MNRFLITQISNGFIVEGVFQGEQQVIHVATKAKLLKLLRDSIVEKEE